MTSGSSGGVGNFSVGFHAFIAAWKFNARSSRYSGTRRLPTAGPLRTMLTHGWPRNRPRSSPRRCDVSTQFFVARSPVLSRATKSGRTWCCCVSAPAGAPADHPRRSRSRRRKGAAGSSGLAHAWLRHHGNADWGPDREVTSAHLGAGGPHWKPTHASPPVPPNIKVSRSVRAGGETKTRKSRRSLALPQRVVAALQDQRGAGGTSGGGRDRGGRTTISCFPHGWALSRTTPTCAATSAGSSREPGWSAGSGRRVSCDTASSPCCRTTGCHWSRSRASWGTAVRR